MTNKEAQELLLLVKEQADVIHKMTELIVRLVEICSKPPMHIMGKE